MALEKKVSTIQVDLDGLWTNLQYYGHDAALSPDAIFETSIPRYLDLFKEFNIKATFFVIGKDAQDPKKRALLKQLHEQGHELANHTYSHIFGLRKCSREIKMQEIQQGEDAIISITGKKPVGFKAPGYDIDPEIMQLLAEKGYRYDSSVIPTFAYPLIMRITSLLTKSVKRTHGPPFHWFLARNTPYHPSPDCEWRKGNSSLLEVPCTVMPFFKIPIHATFATKFGLPYFRSTYAAVRLAKIPLNYEFHAADLADEIHDSRLGHLVGIPLARRMDLCRRMLKMMTAHHTFVTTAEITSRIIKNG